MEATGDNPATNRLGSGVTEKDLQAAVSASGYPLQMIVAGQLSKDFGVSQEWGYVDPDSGIVRTIDIHAMKLLWLDAAKQPKIRPQLDLIIECKRSELPYVFFLSPKMRLLTFPFLCGLHKDHLTLTSNDSLSTWNLPIQEVLGLDTLPFASEPEFSLSFSKCVRQGKDVVLTGEDVFSNAVLPVTKAIKHLKRVSTPPKTAMYFDLHLVIGMVVIDAPIVGVRVSEKTHESMLLPWVRVVRHEGVRAMPLTGPSTDDADNPRYYTIDMVHKDFLGQYLEKHIQPFEQEFSTLAIRHQKTLASGKGFARDLGKNFFSNIETRLKLK